MADTTTYDMYVGSYASSTDQGISRWTLTAGLSTCQFQRLVGTDGIENPSYLRLDRQRRTLYAVSEGDEGQIVSYEIGGAGHGLAKTSVRATHGGSPCHVCLTSDGAWLIVANYMGGNASVHRLNADLSIRDALQVLTHEGHGKNPSRQEAPHPHSAIQDPSGQFVLVPDLGLDRIVIYRFDSVAGTFTAHSDVRLTDESGPRHFAFHPNGRIGYVVNELASTVTRFQWDATQGQLTEQQTVSSLPDGFTGQRWAADIHVSIDGRFLYVSNRGHDSIAVFAIDGQTGDLTAVQFEATRGHTPRNFAITPDGSFLLAANQDSDSVTLFAIDPETGQLSYVGTQEGIQKPTCVQFV